MSGHTEDMKNSTCGLSSLVLGVDEWVQGNSSRAVLPLTRYQCSIHYESSRLPPPLSKGRWAPQISGVPRVCRDREKVSLGAPIQPVHGSMDMGRVSWEQKGVEN